MAERKTERPRRTNPTHALAVTREWSCLLRRRASCPPRRRGRHGRGAPATCAPRGPAPSAGFGSSAPAGRDGRSRGQTSWFAEPRRSAAEGEEGASDSRKPEQEEEAGGIALSRASTPLRGGACAGPSPPRRGHAAPLTWSP